MPKDPVGFPEVSNRKENAKQKTQHEQRPWGMVRGGLEDEMRALWFQTHRKPDRASRAESRSGWGRTGGLACGP